MQYRAWEIIREARMKSDLSVLDSALREWHTNVSRDLEAIIAAAQDLQRSLKGPDTESLLDGTGLSELRAATRKLNDEMPVLATLQFAYPHVQEELADRA